MQVREAQRELRTVYAGGFWGQLVAAVIWTSSAALGTWVSPRAAIITLVVGGFFIFPLTRVLLALTGRPASLSQENPLGALGMQLGFTTVSMLLLVPVAAFRLNWFYPAVLILMGAHYLPFAFLYGMRLFLALGAIFVAAGVVVALYFAGTFSLGGWIGGAVLLLFAWLGRAAVQAESRAESINDGWRDMVHHQPGN